VNDGRIVLTGFGFAKAATHIEKSEPGFVEGKVSYLSPEAALGQNVTWRSDLFSLGVVLWETVAGRRLFQADTDLDTVRLVQKAEIPHLNTVRPGYRGELDGVLHQLLARDPAKRFESTRAARRALEEVLRRGGTFSQDHIANLIAKYREAKPSASKGARSMISSLIDDALLEFTSLDERLPPRVEVPAAITQPEPVADAPFHFEAGNLAILEDDPIPLADHDGPLWSPPARPASVQSAPIGSASALHDGTHAATGQRPSLPLQAWTSLPARPLLSGLLVSFALTLTLAVAYLLTR
jgi:serine/threonine protein kinase